MSATASQIIFPLPNMEEAAMRSMWAKTIGNVLNF